MRVMCINTKPIQGMRNGPEALSLIKETVDYTISDEFNKGTLKHGYVLKEVQGHFFSAQRFIVLPDATASELFNEELEAIVM